MLGKEAVGVVASVVATARGRRAGCFLWLFRRSAPVPAPTSCTGAGTSTDVTRRLLSPPLDCKRRGAPRCSVVANWAGALVLPLLPLLPQPPPLFRSCLAPLLLRSCLAPPLPLRSCLAWRLIFAAWPAEPKPRVQATAPDVQSGEVSGQTGRNGQA